MLVGYLWHYATSGDRRLISFVFCITSGKGQFADCKRFPSSIRLRTIPKNKRAYRIRWGVQTAVRKQIIRGDRQLKVVGFTGPQVAVLNAQHLPLLAVIGVIRACLYVDKGRTVAGVFYSVVSKVC